MLRLRFVHRSTLLALALCAAHPVLAQVVGGISEQLDAAEKKLDADIKACRPINVNDYFRLQSQATANTYTADKAAKAGFPVDTTQLVADVGRATRLLERAQNAAANAKPCPAPQAPQNAGPPPKKIEPPPQPPAPVAGVAGGDEVDPLSALAFQAWGALEDLDDAIWDCDVDEVKKLIPELESLAKRAHKLAQAARAAGKFSKVDPKQIDELAQELDWAIVDAKAFKGCPLKLLPKEQPKTSLSPSPSKHEQPTQAGGKKPSETSTPTPPRYSIVEDLREPATPGELKTIDSQVQELGKLTRDFPNLLEGCHPQIWDKHIGRLNDLAKRAQQIADDAKRGYSKGFDPKEAQRVADEARRAVDEARRGKAQHEAKWQMPCPKYTVPELPLSPPKPTSLAPLRLNPFDQRILDIHNDERFAVHVPPLKWNFQLQQDATAWAQQLSVTRQLVHAPREGRGIERENLLQFNTGWRPDRMMQSWTSEKRDFVPGYYPNVARDGNWLNVSHYTQMIWPTTTDIGCGYAEGGGYGWLVCRYSPGGNKDGKPVGLPSGIPERG